MRWKPLLVGSSPAAALAFLATFLGPARAGAAQGSAPHVERIDSRLEALLGTEPRIEKILDGYTWVEGPLWNPESSTLLFSEIPANCVWEWKEGQGVRRFLERSGYSGTAPFKGREPGSNGLTFDPQGRLVLCQHGDRRVARLEHDGSFTALAERFEGRRLNSPNDAVFRKNGELLFTDPPFGLPGTFDDPHKKLPFSGVYRLAVDGSLHLLVDDLRCANGIALGPDDRTFYVANADSQDPCWMVYQLDDHGAVAQSRRFFDARPFVGKHPGLPDGMKVDANGFVFASGPGGLYVFAPEGAHLGTIVLGVATSNCSFGGPQRRDLFITAGTGIYRVRLEPVPSQEAARD